MWQVFYFSTVRLDYRLLLELHALTQAARSWCTSTCTTLLALPSSLLSTTLQCTQQTQGIVGKMCESVVVSLPFCMLVLGVPSLYGLVFIQKKAFCDFTTYDWSAWVSMLFWQPFFSYQSMYTTSEYLVWILTSKQFYENMLGNDHTCTSNGYITIWTTVDLEIFNIFVVV